MDIRSIVSAAMAAAGIREAAPALAPDYQKPPASAPNRLSQKSRRRRARWAGRK